MKTVWVVTHGENGEGGNIAAVFARKPSQKAVTSLKTPHFGRQWEREGGWEGDEMRWESGCDFLLVEKCKVQ